MNQQQLEQIKSALEYAIELFEDNELEPTLEMFESVKILDAALAP